MAERPTAQDLYKGNGTGEEKSAGRLMKEVTEDLSTLIRKEVELAKQEIGQSIATKVKGVAVIVAGLVFVFFAVIFGLLAIRDGLDEFLWTWVADLATMGALLFFALIAVLVAKKKLTAPISAEMTKQTLKDDAEMVKSLGKR